MQEVKNVRFLGSLRLYLYVEWELTKEEKRNMKMTYKNISCEKRIIGKASFDVRIQTAGAPTPHFRLKSSEEIFAT